MLLTWNLFNATWHARSTVDDIAEMWLSVVSPEAADIINGFLAEAKAQVSLDNEPPNGPCLSREPPRDPQDALGSLCEGQAFPWGKAWSAYLGGMK